MLGEFIVNSLVLVLGYAYPAFECFKCVENNRVQIEELRFWCQYWIPMYSEVKLALFIYLWYPKSKGTEYIYGALLKPFVSEHEGEIERSFMEFKGRAWELVVYYWQNCTELGQAKFFQMLDFLATGRLTQSTSKQKDTDHRHGGAPLPPPAPAATKSGPFRRHR